MDSHARRNGLPNRLLSVRHSITLRAVTRLSDEKALEVRSRAALIERLAEFRWIAEPVDTDVGEDLWVRIFDNESFSGILFLTQLKSRGDITNHERAETIAQRVTTAHLKHWEGSASPVVVIVWDAPKGEGYWLTVDSALRTLSTDKPSFVDQETVTLHVPATNRIDRDGLRRLRSELAQLLLPAVQKERLIEMRLRFKSAYSGHRDQRDRRIVITAIGHRDRSEATLVS